MTKFHTHSFQHFFSHKKLFMAHLSKKGSKYEREKDESLTEEKPRFGVTPLTTMS